MPARAQELATLIGGTALTLSELENYHPEEGMILANATSVGMYPNVNETPLSKVWNLLSYSSDNCNWYILFLISHNKKYIIILQKALRNYSIFFDAVYIPKETRLLREAAECGATVVDGLDMLLRLVMVQFGLFTGGMPGTFLQPFSNSLIWAKVISLSYCLSKNLIVLWLHLTAPRRLMRDAILTSTQ